MKKLFMGLLLFSFLSAAAQNQQPSHPSLYQRLSYQVNMDFQGFSLPFSNLKTYWKNKGISIGTTYNWNRRGTIQQNLRIGVISSPNHGYTRHISTTFQVNPIHRDAISAGFALGAGYMRTGYRNGWQQEGNGIWKNTANKQGLLFVPATLQISVKTMESKHIVVMPTLAYQINVIRNYSPAMQLLPQSIISIGSKIKLK